MRISVIQKNVSDDKRANLQSVAALVERAVEQDRSDFVILPEMIACITASPVSMRESAEPFPGGEVFEFFSGLAKRLKVNLHIGSAMELDDDQVYNTSLVFGREGELLAKYRKIHRFDAVLADGTELKESAHVEAGKEVVCVDVDGVRVGLAICYDLRFPELFQALCEDGAEVIVVPAAFTFQTGADHWEVLLRARAIEGQCYVAAPCQVGTFDKGKYMTWGHSMIIDPWGQVVSQTSNSETFASATIDRAYQQAIRTRMPMKSHRLLARRFLAG
ncbi:carbon-nitrogen hydrolase family protein [Pseudomonas sp. BN415]|uniref:carbon-nitrogen hydrolase family protein n=1 Tax=Pseudomonas sp. BN415 TaxID=2567889 RepID=UPI0024574DE4|nr:carbon-nitrogen hydrolase family protein [Pseudomonas sp. BN415]MDH4583186.1 carbon-nitrogen hydrolase family protein [Pseudomonas sp. BN415]